MVAVLLALEPSSLWVFARSPSVDNAVSFLAMNTLIFAVSERGAPAIEHSIVWLVQWLRLGIETISALLVAVGVAVAVAQPLRQFAAKRAADFTATRLTLAR